MKIDGTVVGSFAPAESAQSYALYTASFTASSASSHTIEFVGTDANGGDNTIFIDEVSLAPSSAKAAALAVPPNSGVSGSSAPVTKTPLFASLLSRGQLGITWPADHMGWQLQAQTSSLAGGIGTNWITIPGSELSTQYNCTIDPGMASKSVLFRLVPAQ